ncbi:hypothetical protein DQ04_07721010 [Trypanosoma grayi]|uniref:hypothetical protein n=1 Tax=Trypanosoma grayi TaxID=71804 RepID=UPI0004F44DD0|nr:hypothetical protein DQ04_07721010 [Trypanosoma grayi]KEG08213.1 hypothetical protein DQ04_07721010 [Trypanosoma grayi]
MDEQEQIHDVVRKATVIGKRKTEEPRKQHQQQHQNRHQRQQQQQHEQRYDDTAAADLSQFSLGDAGGEESPPLISPGASFRSSSPSLFTEGMELPIVLASHSTTARQQKQEALDQQQNGHGGGAFPMDALRSACERMGKILDRQEESFREVDEYVRHNSVLSLDKEQPRWPQNHHPHHHQQQQQPGEEKGGRAIVWELSRPCSHKRSQILADDRSMTVSPTSFTPRAHSVTLCRPTSIPPVSFHEMTPEEEAEVLEQLEQQHAEVEEVGSPMIVGDIPMQQPVSGNAAQDASPVSCVSISSVASPMGATTAMPLAAASIPWADSVTVSPLSRPLSAWFESPHSMYLTRRDTHGVSTTGVLTPTPLQLPPGNGVQFQLRNSSSSSPPSRLGLDLSSSAFTCSFSGVFDASAGRTPKYSHPHTPMQQHHIQQRQPFSVSRPLGSSSEAIPTYSVSADSAIHSGNDLESGEESVTVASPSLADAATAPAATTTTTTAEPVTTSSPGVAAPLPAARVPPVHIMGRPPPVPQRVPSPPTSPLLGSRSPLDTSFHSVDDEYEPFFNDDDDDNNKEEGTYGDGNVVALHHHCRQRLFSPSLSRWRSSRRNGTRDTTKRRKHAGDTTWDMSSRLQELEQIRLTNHEALEGRELQSIAASEVDVTPETPPIRGGRRHRHRSISQNELQEMDVARVFILSDSKDDDKVDNHHGALPHQQHQHEEEHEDAEEEEEEKEQPKPGEVTTMPPSSLLQKETHSKRRCTVPPLNVLQISLAMRSPGGAASAGVCESNDEKEETVSRLTGLTCERYAPDSSPAKSAADSDAVSVPADEGAEENTHGGSPTSSHLSTSERRCLRLRTPTATPRVLLKRTPRSTALPRQRALLAPWVHNLPLRRRNEAMMRLAACGSSRGRGEGLMGASPPPPAPGYPEADGRDYTYRSRRRRRIVVPKPPSGSRSNSVVLRRSNSINNGVTPVPSPMKMTAAAAVSSSACTGAAAAAGGGGGRGWPHDGSTAMCREGKAGDEPVHPPSPSAQHITTTGTSSSPAATLVTASLCVSVERHRSRSRSLRAPGCPSSGHTQPKQGSVRPAAGKTQPTPGGRRKAPKNSILSGGSTFFSQPRATRHPASNTTAFGTQLLMHSSSSPSYLLEMHARGGAVAAGCSGGSVIGSLDVSDDRDEALCVAHDAAKLHTHRLFSDASHSTCSSTPPPPPPPPPPRRLTAGFLDWSPTVSPSRAKTQSRQRPDFFFPTVAARPVESALAPSRYAVFGDSALVSDVSAAGEGRRGAELYGKPALYKGIPATKKKRAHRNSGGGTAAAAAAASPATGTTRGGSSPWRKSKPSSVSPVAATRSYIVHGAGRARPPAASTPSVSPTLPKKAQHVAWSGTAENAVFLHEWRRRHCSFTRCGTELCISPQRFSRLSTAPS